MEGRSKSMRKSAKGKLIRCYLASISFGFIGAVALFANGTAEANSVDQCALWNTGKVVAVESTMLNDEIPPPIPPPIIDSEPDPEYEPIPDPIPPPIPPPIVDPEVEPIPDPIPPPIPPPIVDPDVEPIPDQIPPPIPPPIDY